MITIVDYGVGNLRSIHKAIEFVGGNAVVTSDAGVIEEADAIVLPGVGAFKPAMDRLKSFEKLIKDANVPVMGICLGMQLFATESEEGGLYEGLDVIPGRVVKFPADVGKIPHMGWNQIKIHVEHPLLEGVKDGSYVYFVHSYHMKTDSEHVLSTTDYGIEFVSAVFRDNFVGFQFHPEKSGREGLKIIKNFVKLAGK
ncbi:imidazole glycerol phosphate synthase subunit HisH [Archaeoglobus veneficus]|uniref:Imidazole glycerol phosphate synthase subunit HisH n=1 Tax=Archaeoglobus veneficus (strain DSM 11195 / SNP6) TaxID=693661 RepID=F2KP95_ARCVS|nr:imidazole glycerol phosphate synthase subunit HisH [Archaeoglobus veneficus]AEA47499.1 Imidazole glycerol phosphate synthase subunit hisH [Archaeoglobus veneficus SNP6]